VSEFCLTPTRQLFSYIMAKTSCISIRRWYDNVRFVLDQHA